jgi:hypothetical protein
MALRWTAAAMHEAKKGFRRLKVTSTCGCMCKPDRKGMNDGFIVQPPEGTNSSPRIAR